MVVNVVCLPVPGSMGVRILEPEAGEARQIAEPVQTTRDAGVAQVKRRQIRQTRNR